MFYIHFIRINIYNVSRHVMKNEKIMYAEKHLSKTHLISSDVILSLSKGKFFPSFLCVTTSTFRLLGKFCTLRSST